MNLDLKSYLSHAVVPSDPNDEAVVRKALDAGKLGEIERAFASIADDWFIDRGVSYAGIVRPNGEAICAEWCARQLRAYIGRDTGGAVKSMLLGRYAPALLFSCFEFTPLVWWVHRDLRGQGEGRRLIAAAMSGMQPGDVLYQPRYRGAIKEMSLKHRV